MIKKALFLLLAFILIYLLYHHKAVRYGLEQAYGQYQVISNAVPLEQIKENPNTADSVICKLNWIEEVKTYAIDELGLAPSNSYTSYYDQNGEPILWVVTASPEFEIKTYEWDFPIAGSFTYKGFFKRSKAEVEILKLKAEGYDIDLGEVNAWSTLGYFNDPILSSMLEDDSARLAELIIHELFHGTIYIKDSVEMNENLANFIGKQGSIRLLKSIQADSLLNNYLDRFERRKKFNRYLFEALAELDKFYKSLTAESNIEIKRKLKAQKLAQIKERLLSFSLKKTDKFKEFELNNAFFTSLKTYRSKQTNYESQLEEQFDGNLKAFIEYYKELYD